MLFQSTQDVVKYTYEFSNIRVDLAIQNPLIGQGEEDEQAQNI